MTSSEPAYDLGKPDDRLRSLEQRFAWGVGAAGAIGLIVLLSGGFTTDMLDGAVNQAIAAIDGKAAEAIDTEWREIISRLNRVGTVMLGAVVAFDSQIGCPDGWSACDHAPVLFGLDAGGLEPAFDRVMADIDKTTASDQRVDPAERPFNHRPWMGPS